MQVPFISIIIPTYNSAATLSIALGSIVNQTFNDWEVIIVDGLSTDNTLEIAKRFQEQYFGKFRIYSEKDKGIYDAMNKGIDLTKGDWLYFMGSDDRLFETTTLEKISEIVNNKNVDIVYGNVKIIGDTGWAKDGTIYDGEFTTEKILNKNICHQAIFYKTKFVKDRIGYFNLKYTICSDWDFNLHCWSKTNFYYIDIVISNFFSGGLSTNAGDKEFSNDFLSNILIYFKINAFNKMVNSTNFKRYSEVKEMQKRNYPYRFKLEKFIKYFFKKAYLIN